MKLVENSFIDPYKEVILEPTLLDKQKNPLFEIVSPPEKHRKGREPVLIHFVQAGIVEGHPIIINKLKEMLRSEHTKVEPGDNHRYYVSNPYIVA